MYLYTQNSRCRTKRLNFMQYNSGLCTMSVVAVVRRYLLTLSHRIAFLVFRMGFHSKHMLLLMRNTNIKCKFHPTNDWLTQFSLSHNANAIERMRAEQMQTTNKRMNEKIQTRVESRVSILVMNLFAYNVEKYQNLSGSDIPYSLQYCAKWQ